MRVTLGVLAVLALMLGSACGFHLRGRVPLPTVMARPYVETDDHYTALYSALVAQLRSAGAEPAAAASDSSAVIRLHEDESGRDLLSVTADNKPGEYEVFYAVEFSVAQGASELIPKQQIRLTRNYGYDETAVLAKEHEEQSLRVALAGEIAALILRRVAAL